MTDTPSAELGRYFPENERLFREGDPGDRMYVIQAGRVRISKSVAGVDKVLAELGPGEFFGEMAILNGKPRTATAVTIEPTRCLTIDARTLEEMISRNTEIALRLIKKLASRLDSADSLVQILLHADPKARVLLALAREAEAFGEPCPEGVRVNVSLDELAKRVSTERGVAEQMMARVRRLGIAYVAGDHVVVTEIERLVDFIDFLGIAQPSSGSRVRTAPYPASSPGVPVASASEPGSGDPGRTSGAS